MLGQLIRTLPVTYEILEHLFSGFNILRSHLQVFKLVIDIEVHQLKYLIQIFGYLTPGFPFV